MFAGAAGAAEWVATYKGVVNGGYDATGVFGDAGTDLSGKAFTATFRYDLGLGSVTASPTGEMADLAVLEAVLYVGDGAYNFGSGFENHIQTSTDSLYPNGPGYVYHAVSTDFFASPLFYFFESLTLAGGAAAPAFLGQAVAETAIVNPGDGGPADYVGFFSIDSNFLGSGANAFGDLRPESYSVAEAPTGGVPEPATWGLMILGFGAAGVSLRRRRALA